jgi:MFS family permease
LVPAALFIGKRPVFIFASFVLFASTIWAAKATSFHSLVGARVVSAIAATAGEALTAAISADIFFLHERGWWMGFYLIFLCGGISLGGLVSGFIINALGWRWHFWVNDSLIALLIQ